jgi:hypothetical protein
MPGMDLSRHYEYTDTFQAMIKGLRSNTLVSLYPAHVDWGEHLGTDPPREMQASQEPTKPCLK